MNIDFVFKIAAIGIIVAVLNQLLIRSGREEQAMMTTLAGLIVVLMMIISQIYTRESLGAALASYEGTLVLVTHDRYLMNSLACPILFIENGKTSLYEDYDAMMHRGAVPPEKNIAPEKTASAGKAAYGKEQRRRRAELRTRIKALEDEMETLALRIMALEGEVNDPDVLRDHARLRDVCDELDDTRFHQDEVLAEWERLVEEQEAYEQENDE